MPAENNGMSLDTGDMSDITRISNVTDRISNVTTGIISDVAKHKLGVIRHR